MERKIGEVFDFEGKRLIVEESKSGCDDCFFNVKCTRGIKSVTGLCRSVYRDDKKDVIFVEVKDEQQQEQAEQPQELNLCEILKYCPDGETFWSPMFGDVKFYGINMNRKLVKVLENGYIWNFNSDGTITLGRTTTSPEIMLYPSREQRDWTKVKYEPKKELPKTWEEFCQQNPTLKREYFIDDSSCVRKAKIEGDIRHKEYDRNTLPSREAAEAHLALIQLHQLRDAWREGWVPDWKDGGKNKYVIANDKGESRIWDYQTIIRFLAFQDKKRAEEFLKCFRDLIEKAGDLI